MRYLLVFLPFFFFPINHLTAQDMSDDLGTYQSAPKGMVTTRTGGPVITRSFDITKNKETYTTNNATASQQKKSKKQKLSTSQAKTENIKDESGIKEIFKQDAASYRQEGHKLQAAGDLSSALSYYQKALQLDPYNLETVNDIGIIYEGLGDSTTAVAMYKKALEMDPKYLPAYANLAFLYESKGDTENATYYWRKRYELGTPGDYWRETAKKHLMELGTYPEVQREMIDKEVAKLSRDFSEKKMQRQEQAIEDAKRHFNSGVRLYAKKDYLAALKEFETALTLNPQDSELKVKIMNFYKKTQKAYVRDESLAETQEALKDIKNDDYSSAARKLRDALSTVFRVSQEK